MFENKKFIIPVVIFLAIISGVWLGTQIRGENKSKRAQKLEEIMALLDKNYVDSINKEDIFTAAIQEMLHKLDPHSRYITKSDFDVEKQAMNGYFGGIGVRFQILRDTVAVLHVIKGSPSERAGLKSGDKIVEINGSPFVGPGIDYDKTMKLLKGSVGTNVNVKCLRNKKSVVVKITRGDIVVESVSASYMINAKTGFIRIEQFSIPAADEFHRAAQDLLRKGMKSLILDLRGNPGGVLDVAVAVTDEFLKKGRVIVSTKGKSFPNEVKKSTDYGVLSETKLVVLIDQNSASASEILAGAIQDNDRGTIVGRRSYGKGLVQQDQVLTDGSSVRITVARYYAPSGRCIQRDYSGNYDDYARDAARYEKGELYAEDTLINKEEKKYKTTNGRIVYGGRGIMPDVFMGIDTTSYTRYFIQLNWELVFTSFVFDHLSTKRTYYEQEFNVILKPLPEALVSKFRIYADKTYQIKATEEEWAKSKKLVINRIQQEVARQVWEEKGFYSVANQTDKEVLKAIEILR